LVIYNRNQVLVEGDTKVNIWKEHEFTHALLELCGKIFIFYVIAQLVGGFEWANKGYCRTTGGYNIRKKDNDTILPPQQDTPRIFRAKMELYRQKLQTKTLYQKIFGTKDNKSRTVGYTTSFGTGSVRVPNTRFRSKRVASSIDG